MHTEPSQLLAVLILTCTVRMVTFANEYNGRKGKKERGKKKMEKKKGQRASSHCSSHSRVPLPDQFAYCSSPQDAGLALNHPALETVETVIMATAAPLEVYQTGNQANFPHWDCPWVETRLKRAIPGRNLNIH